MTNPPNQSHPTEIEQILHRVWVKAVENGYLYGTQADFVQDQAKQAIQSLIRQQTLKGQIETVKWMQKQIPKKVTGVNYGTPETNPHGWAYETYIEAWKPILKDRIKALTSELEELDSK